MVARGKFDTEEFQKRLFSYASDCRTLTIKLPRVEYNRVYSRQLIRSSSSPGANYIEALEAMSSKDFIHKLRVCRKEVRESVYWLRHVDEANKKIGKIGTDCIKLIAEGTELKKILSSSIINA